MNSIWPTRSGRSASKTIRGRAVAHPPLGVIPAPRAPKHDRWRPSSDGHDLDRPNLAVATAVGAGLDRHWSIHDDRATAAGGRVALMPLWRVLTAAAALGGV